MNDSQEKIIHILDVLSQIERDTTVSKSTRSKIKSAINVFSQSDNMGLRVDKVRHELDEVADDPNLPTYTRTQIWNIVSIIETLQ